MKHLQYQVPLLLCLSVTCFSVATGCSKHEVAQVRGKVIFKNAAMPAAAIRMVRLEPASDTTAAVRKGASGKINDDGTFEISTLRPGDGVHLDNYSVTFTFLKSYTDQKQMLAKKYTTAATSPYRLNVDRNIDNLEYELEPADAAAH